jgi:hypothetical protein
LIFEIIADTETGFVVREAELELELEVEFAVVVTDTSVVAGCVPVESPLLLPPIPVCVGALDCDVEESVIVDGVVGPSRL